MENENIKKAFQDFIDNASEETLKDFVKYMKERKKSKQEELDKIEALIKENDSLKNQN